MIIDLINLIYYSMKIYLQKKQVFSFDWSRFIIYLAWTRKEIKLRWEWKIYKDNVLIYSYDNKWYYQKRYLNFNKKKWKKQKKK